MKRREVVKLWTVVEAQVVKLRLWWFSKRLDVVLCPAACCLVSLHLSASASASPPSAARFGCLLCLVPGQSPPGHTFKTDRRKSLCSRSPLHSSFKIESKPLGNGLSPTNSEEPYLRFVVPVIEEIVWFNVSVNDSKLVDVSQSLQQVVDVEPDFFKAH